MEATFKQFRYIDLATLTSSGQRKLIDVYKKLLQEFPKQKKSKEPSDFEKKIIELSHINNEKNICIGKDINISRLTDNL
jgi:lysyl-tRNA synthetase class I